MPVGGGLQSIAPGGHRRVLGSMVASVDEGESELERVERHVVPQVARDVQVDAGGHRGTDEGVAGTSDDGNPVDQPVALTSHPQVG